MAKNKASTGKSKVFPVGGEDTVASDYWKSRGRFSKTALKQKPNKSSSFEEMPENNNEKPAEHTKRQKLERFIKEEAQQAKKKRGRPPKAKETEMEIPKPETSEVKKRGRGRPPKAKAEAAELEQAAPKKKRGRPPKPKEEAVQTAPKKRGRPPKKEKN